MEKLKDTALSVVQSAIKRKTAEQKYQEEIYGPKRKTKQSKETRVDKRTFNKGRPKKVVVKANVDINVSPNISVAPKKLNQVEKTAAQVIAGYMRSKIDANTLQPAIYSDLVGKKIKEELDKKDIPITEKKKRGRPKKVV